MSRYETLLNLYRQKNDQEPTEEDKYILDLITRLKDVYDNNYINIKTAKNCAEENAFKQKEVYLNRIGELLRKFIGIHIVQSPKNHRHDRPEEVIEMEQERLETEEEIRRLCEAEEFSCATEAQNA